MVSISAFVNRHWHGVTVPGQNNGRNRAVVQDWWRKVSWRMTVEYENALLAEEAVLAIVELFRNWEAGIEWCRKVGADLLG
jgi:hypothetical protein